MFEELIGLCRRSAVDDQPAIGRVDPAVGCALADEGARQQAQRRLVKDFTQLAAPDPPPFVFLDLLHLFGREALDDRYRQQLFLDAEGEQVL